LFKYPQEYDMYDADYESKCRLEKAPIEKKDYDTGLLKLEKKKQDMKRKSEF